MKILDSTQALLDSTIPEIIDSVCQDSEEEDIFFGNKSDKELKGEKRGKSRRDTVDLSGWDWKSHRDKLSTSSSTTGRSSLLDAENSILEEDEGEDEDEDVFENSPGGQSPTAGEIEIFQLRGEKNNTQENLELGVSVSGSTSLEISGIQPLASSQSFQDESASGIFDSFSDDTMEEMLDEEMGDEEEKLAHVKRKILQDSTFMSSVSSLEDPEVTSDQKSPGSGSRTPPLAPSILVTEPIADDSAETVPASPESVYYTAPSSRRNTSVGGAESPQFDTTMEEMALYELYGEDYDEKVAAMSREEKVQLKRKLENRGEEEKEKIQLKFEKMAEAELSGSKLTTNRSQLLSVGSTISPFSLSPSTTTPSPVSSEFLSELNQGKEEEEPMEMESTSPAVAAAADCLTSPRFPNNFMLPTAASLSKMSSRSPSPRKRMVWLPPSPSPSKACVKSPQPQSSARRHTPVSKLPLPVKRPCPDPLSELTPGSRTPMSRRVAGIKTAYASVASPVASYVKNNPAPHLVQNVKAKEPETPLDSTIVEVEGKENNARLSLLPQCPLPSAIYKASAVVAGAEDPSEGRDEYEYVTEAYGAVTQSAKVTKHVSRVQVPNTGLVWNEDLLANDQSCNSSPSVAKFKLPGKSVLKSSRRDSGLFDESMMNVSVVETKVVKKVARGKGGARGRGKGKGKQRLIDRNPYH